MSRFLTAVKKNIKKKKQSGPSERDLQTWGLKGIALRSYQLQGVQWLTQGMSTLGGCILADEMGLGKTCQAIGLMVYAQGCRRMNGPFLVLCPIGAVNYWEEQIQKLSRLSYIRYTGNKKERADLQIRMQNETFHILLTNYEMCHKDEAVLKRRDWKILVMDEAQRVKNEFCKLHQILTEFSFGFKLMLSGTPIQNSLQEVYSLLTFIQPDVFTPDATAEFINTYANVQNDSSLAVELHQVLKPFLLRRVKADVGTDLPDKTQVVVYHGMSALQKKYYKAILMKNLAVFGQDKGTENRLLNILMQLRKCVCHPYLFNGVEPEPFEIGEHLVEASGKLSLLDLLLPHMLKEGHNILMFSQMTRMLDIMQDYLEYRGYSYERLDGSLRSEERTLAIKNFSNKNVFIFLLSTKAGGVCLNLMAADTVIFLDSDFNPHNDLQAECRAHRIGQKRTVKVFRLLGRDTVEEIIFSRALAKLKLSNTVIGSGQFSLMDSFQAADQPPLSDMIKFGFHKLLSSDESSVLDVDIMMILGQSRRGQWVIDKENFMPAAKQQDNEQDEEQETKTHMYYYEGMDYSKIPSVNDEEKFKLLQREQLSSNKGRNKAELPSTSRPKRNRTESKLDKNSPQRKEAAAKRAKMQEEKKQRRKEQKHKEKMALWDSHGYTSLCLPSADNDDDDVNNEEEEDGISVISTDTGDDTEIHYVVGDVTHPRAKTEDGIIVHCVDNSGWWGRGGLFTALEVRSDEVKTQYELAGEMKDLDLGNVLLFPIDDKQSRQEGRDYLALIVAQRRNKANTLSGICFTSLEAGLKKIYKAAKEKTASVHLPRIGHATKGFNWYGTERLIRKHLSSRGVPTFIYYYKRTDSQSPTASSSTDSQTPSTSYSAFCPPTPVSPSSSDSLSPPGPSEERAESPECSRTSQQDGQASGFADFMKGVSVFFFNVGVTERKHLARDLITYDGEEVDQMSSQITHIVAEVESPAHVQELQELRWRDPQVILVNKEWLESCFAAQKKLRTSKYNLCLE